MESDIAGIEELTKKLRGEAQRFLNFLDREQLPTLPLSPARANEENVFTRSRSSKPAKARKHQGGHPPAEYTIVEMIEDLRLALQRNGDAEEIASLYYPLVRVLKY